MDTFGPVAADSDHLEKVHLVSVAAEKDPEPHFAKGSPSRTSRLCPLGLLLSVAKIPVAGGFATGCCAKPGSGLRGPRTGRFRLPVFLVLLPETRCIYV